MADQEIVDHPHIEIVPALKAAQDPMDCAGTTILSEAKLESVIHPATSVVIIMVIAIHILHPSHSRETTRPAASDGDIPDWQKQ